MDTDKGQILFKSRTSVIFPSWMKVLYSFCNKTQLSKEERFFLHQNLGGVEIKGILKLSRIVDRIKIGLALQTLPEWNVLPEATANTSRGRTRIGRFSFTKVKSCTSIKWLSPDIILHTTIIFCRFLKWICRPENLPAENWPRLLSEGAPALRTQVSPVTKAETGRLDKELDGLRQNINIPGVYENRVSKHFVFFWTSPV